MSPAEQTVTAYECPSWGSVGWHDGQTCCDQPMEAIETTTVYEPPGLEAVVQDVFDMSPTAVRVCREVMAKEAANVSELAAELDYDRSTITRHLNHLVDLGLVEKRERTLSEGGRAYVYAPKPAEDVRRQFKLGLCGWFEDAMGAVDELSREKVEAMADQAMVQTDSIGSQTPDGNQRETEIAETNGGADREPGDSLLSRLFGRRRS